MTDKAKLFMDGDSQAVRLPDHYRFDGDEVYIRHDPETGNVILSARPNGWDEFFGMLDEDPMPEDFLADRGQGELPGRSPSDEAGAATDMRTAMKRIANSNEQWDEFMESLKTEDKKRGIVPKS
jgi:antitoxin VapB